MKTVNKKIAIFVAMILACASIGSSVAFASEPQLSTPEDQNIELRYTHIQSCRSSLSISNGKAGILAIYAGKTSLEKVVMTVRLQKKVSGTWLTQSQWSKTSTALTSTFDTTYTVSRGTYRVSTTFKVNDGAETATANSVTVVY